MPFGADECYKPADRDDISHTVIMCEADKFVAINNFDGTDCSTKVADAAPATGFVPNVCYNFDADTYIKVTDLALEGNRYGFGYLSGWGIFFCQVWFFGLCNGW